MLYNNANYDQMLYTENQRQTFCPRLYSQTREKGFVSEQLSGLLLQEFLIVHKLDSDFLKLCSVLYTHFFLSECLPRTPREAMNIYSLANQEEKNIFQVFKHKLDDSFLIECHNNNNDSNLNKNFRQKIVLREYS